MFQQHTADLMPFAITKPGGINIPAPSVYIFRLKVPSAKNRDTRRLKLPSSIPLPSRSPVIFRCDIAGLAASVFCEAFAF